MTKYVTILVLVIIASSMYPAYAAQLDVSIPEKSKEIEPTFQFTRIVTIQYDNDSTLAKLVGDTQKKISFDINSENANTLVNLLNSKLEEKSFVKISDISGKYTATITPRVESVGIEYNIILRPVIQDYFIENTAILDSQWRGFWISEEIPIETKYGPYDINSPKSVLSEMIPKNVEFFSSSNAMKILEIPLIDARGISELSLSKWESMFDPTALMSEKDEYGFSGTVITNYSMGICTVFRGICEDKMSQEDFVIDNESYHIQSIESQDDATIVIERYAKVGHLGELEIFTIQDNAPSISENTQVSELYIIAGIGVIVALGFFVWSNKKVKNTSTEQTGVDPKDLCSVPIGNNAGSYQTNRGTSHIIQRRTAQ